MSSWKCMKTKKIESGLKCFFTRQRFRTTNSMIVNQEQQQRYEDTYGNEVKRRRMNDDGAHLKVWRAYQSICTSDAEKKKREAVDQDEDVQIVQEVQEVQEVVEIKEEEEAVQELQPQQPQQHPQQDQEAAPVHMIGRVMVVLTTRNQRICGTLQELLVLNGERAIHITTEAGENFILTSSQIQALKVLYDRPPEQPQPQQEEMLSPIPRDEDDEVVQVDDSNSCPTTPRRSDEVIQIEDDEDDEEVEQINQMFQVIQIDDDRDNGDNGDDDATTVQMERDDREDDFPDVAFQPARIIVEDEDHGQDHGQEEEHECCAICFDPTDPTRNFVSLNCGHQFHFACIMGNMASGSENRNRCPMCRDHVNDAYDVHNLEEIQEQRIEDMIQRAAQGNQRLQDELELTRQHREVLTEEYVRVMSMNMQIGMRHNEERDARDALERRAEMCNLNERIVAIVENAANNELNLRRNQQGSAVHVHIERQIRDLCMSFGMMAYDAQYDDQDDEACSCCNFENMD